jgi:hypothetical protein
LTVVLGEDTDALCGEEKEMTVGTEFRLGVDGADCCRGGGRDFGPAEDRPVLLPPPNINPENDLGLAGAECCLGGGRDCGPVVGLPLLLSLETDLGLARPENDIGLAGDAGHAERRLEASSEATDFVAQDLGVMGRKVGVLFAADFGVLGEAGGLFVCGDGTLLGGLGIFEPAAGAELVDSLLVISS